MDYTISYAREDCPRIHGVRSLMSYSTTAVVCVVCSFTAGLLLGVLLTQCHGHCHRKGKKGQTEIPPVFPLENTPAIELTSNVAYGPTSM